MLGKNEKAVKTKPNVYLMNCEVKKSVRTGLTGSWSGIRHIYQRAGGLGQGLVVDCVCDCGRLLFLGLPEVVISQ